jgi:Holliday junction DNA helicase RuvA
MISYLEGEVQKVLPDSAVVLVGGVGYQVYLPQRDLKSLQEGERKAFYTFLNLKQNGVELYGFAQSEERELFKELISLAQVGPRTALAILSVFRLKELREVVAREDAQALARVPGLGPKTARRILREMKEKLEGVEPLEISADSGAVREKKDLAVEALASLGYPVSQAREVVQNLQADFESLSVEEIVRLALSKVGGGVKS